MINMVSWFSFTFVFVTNPAWQRCLLFVLLKTIGNVFVACVCRMKNTQQKTHRNTVNRYSSVVVAFILFLLQTKDRFICNIWDSIPSHCVKNDGKYENKIRSQANHKLLLTRTTATADGMGEKPFFFSLNFHTPTIFASHSSHVENIYLQNIHSQQKPFYKSSLAFNGTRMKSILFNIASEPLISNLNSYLMLKINAWHETNSSLNRWRN